MKILIAVHTYFPDQNGVAIVTQYIAEGLAKQHEVFVITETKGKYDRHDNHKDVNIIRIDVRSARWGFIGEKECYRSKIDEIKPDCFICVCTQSWTFDWITDKLSTISDCIKVLYTHGYSGYFEKYPVMSELLHGRYQQAKYYYRWRKYYRRAYRYINKFELVTYLWEKNNAALYARKYRLTNGIVLENAVDNRIFVKAAERLKVSKTEETIQYICVANYDENKNQEMLIQGFYDLESKNKKLTLIGNSQTDYMDELINLRDDLDRIKGEHNIDILFGLGREKVIELLAESDVFVFCSKHEQYPMVLCEAAAMGMPIISTDVGHANIIPGTIIIHEQYELTDGMQQLYENKKIRENMGILNKKFAEKHYRIEEKVRVLSEKIEKLREQNLVEGKH